MTSGLEYTLNCQICFEEYEETGDHVPRLLPCTHTLCETCIGQLIRRDRLACPECRQTHSATRGRKSFPQNKYILENKRRRISKDQQRLVNLCEKHNRPTSLYCREADCQKLICPLCLKDDHRNHDFVEAQQTFEEKRNMLVEQFKAVQNKLLSKKERLVIAREDAKKNTTECTEKIQKERNENIKMMAEFYDKMITKVKNNYIDVNSKVYQETTKIDDSFGLLNDIKESSKAAKSVEDIMEMIATVNMLAQKETKPEETDIVKHFQYHGYKSLTLDDLQKMAGSLDIKDAPANVEPLQKLLFRSKIHPLKRVQDASQLKLEGKENSIICKLFSEVIFCVSHCSQKHKNLNCSCFILQSKEHSASTSVLYQTYV